jgi:hypothetical protein
MTRAESIHTTLLRTHLCARTAFLEDDADGDRASSVLGYPFQRSRV